MVVTSQNQRKKERNNFWQNQEKQYLCKTNNIKL